MKLFTHLLFSLLFFSFASQGQELYDKTNLTAWCIVPFDITERGPSERMEMLKDLGFEQYVYDWRVKHLDTFEAEIAAARRNNISMEGVWMWVDDKNDSNTQLSEGNTRLLNILKKTRLETTIWLGFNYNFFEGLSHEEKVDKGVAFLKFLASNLKALNCDIALYNHGDWFGEPENQIEIIEKSQLTNVSIVYSFHHGHHQVNRFPSMLKSMLPYLNTVNINGMDIDQAQILYVGEGKQEREMLEILKESGFKGRIGIIGHREKEDVKKVLLKNMNGLEIINNSLRK